MIIFHILLALIGLFVALLIIFFMKRPNVSPSVTEVNKNIFKHQFHEIQQDFKMGVISKKEFDTIHNELSKRVLKYSFNKISNKQYENKFLNRIIKIISIPSLVLFSFLFYYYNGQPSLPDLPLSDRKDNIVPAIFYEQAIKDIDKRISKDQDSIELYILKANTLSALDKSEEALKIWKFVIENFNEKLNAEIYLSYGETIIQNIVNQENTIIITKEAKDIFEKASKLSRIETEIGALTRFYLGLYDYQNGKIDSAKETWEEIIMSSPDGALWKKQIQSQVNQIFNSQDEKDNEQIYSMVSGLAKRLYDTNSKDINEWNKLGRSYVVLGLFDEAIKAYKKANNLDADNLDSLKGLAESMLLNSEKDQAVDKTIIYLFENILLKDANYPLALWVLAEHEILLNNFVKAKELLNRILIQLSEGTEEYNLVLKKLKELNN